MYKIFKITAIIVSIMINLVFGFFYLKGYVYEMGVQAVVSEVNTAIQNGQLIIPNSQKNE